MRLEVIQECAVCPFISGYPQGKRYCSRDSQRRVIPNKYTVPVWCPLITESVTLTAVRKQ